MYVLCDCQCFWPEVLNYPLSSSVLQATLGQCSTKQPGVFDLVGRAKWTAWNSLGEISKVCCHLQYGLDSQHVVPAVNPHH